MGKKVAAQRAKVEAADAAIAELQEEVLQLGGVKLRSLKSKVETLKEQVAGIAGELTRKEVAREAKDKETDKLQKAIDKSKAALEEQQAKNEEIRSSFETLEKQALEKMQEYEKLQAEQAEIDDALSQMQKEHEQAKEKKRQVCARGRVSTGRVFRCVRCLADAATSMCCLPPSDALGRRHAHGGRAVLPRRRP